jgi:hypothetical protein
MLLVLVAAVPLSGWLASEDGPFSPHAGKGVVGSLVGQLKREDDEQEVHEIAEIQPSQEERELGREHVEALQLEETESQEQEQPGSQERVQAEPQEQAEPQGQEQPQTEPS